VFSKSSSGEFLRQKQHDTCRISYTPVEVTLLRKSTMKRAFQITNHFEFLLMRCVEINPISCRGLEEAAQCCHDALNRA
jgi:hypothetical protein